MAAGQGEVKTSEGIVPKSGIMFQVKQLRETIDDYNQEIQDYKSKEKRMTELQAKVDAYDKNIDETLNVKIKWVQRTWVIWTTF